MISHQNVSVRFRLLGLPQVVLQRVPELSPRVSVEVFGYVEHDRVLQEMREADIFVLPSYGEGMPNSLLEAMAAGLPVVVTDVGANTEVVNPGLGGIIVPVGCPRDLMTAILSLCGDRERRVKMGRENAARIRSTFSEGRIVSLLDRVYRKTLLSRQISRH